MTKTTDNTDVYLVFCGPIDQQNISRIFTSLSNATDPSLGIKRIHILFQSTGGFINDGICLYNFFKSFPLELIIYNVGSVQSIATIAYLGVKRRVTSASATFMIHKAAASPQFANASRIKMIGKSLLTDDDRIESIIRAHVSLTDEQWKEHANHDLIFTGEEAVGLKIATDIGDFSPVGRIFNI